MAGIIAEFNSEVQRRLNSAENLVKENSKKSRALEET